MSITELDYFEQFGGEGFSIRTPTGADRLIILDYVAAGRARKYTSAALDKQAHDIIHECCPAWYSLPEVDYYDTLEIILTSTWVGATEAERQAALLNCADNEGY